MAAILWDDVVDLQANLSTVSAGAQAKILDYVNNGLSPAAFGGEDSPGYVLARVYLAAHLAELERRKGEGDVSSETISATSISFDYGTSGDMLSQTSWGSQYAEMLAASPGRIGVTW